MLELGVAGQEKPIIQHHGAIPAAGIHENQMPVGGLQHQNAAAGIFRLNSRLASNLASYRFSQQITDSLDTSGGIDISQHPLHGASLSRDICLGKIADHLPLAYIHLGAVIGV